MIPAALTEAVAAAHHASLEGAVALIRPFLCEIGWFEALMAGQLRAMRADPLHLPPLRATRTGDARHLVIARTERVWITATVIEAGDSPSPHVHFSGRVTLSRSLRGPVQAQCYRMAEGRAVAVGARTWPEGAVIERDERVEALCLDPSALPRLLLRAQIAPPGPVHAHVHDRAGGDTLAAVAADEGHARTLMLLSLLRAQGRRDAAGHFVRALDAPLAGQRWAVMREYLALDTGGALPALQAMASGEADGTVRALALRTLDQIAGAPCPA